MLRFFLIVFCISLMSACSNKKELPILGNRDYQTKIVNGKEVQDTIYHTIKDFNFVNQDSQPVVPATFQDKIYIADFFFTSCPTICPTVKTQMLRIYEKYEGNKNVVLLSHTLDTKYDTPEVLNSYAKKLEIETNRWHMVTGEKDDIYTMAKQYFIAAAEDPNSPGGYTHSGGLVLVDRDKFVRGVYDGTEKDQVTELLGDIDVLLKEQGLK